MIARGKTVAMETEQLDFVMFGTVCGPTHPVTVAINQLKAKIWEAKNTLDEVALPRLQQRKECLDYHLLQHRSQSLTSALFTLTSSTAQLPPVGHSLQSAESTLQKHNENNQRLEVKSSRAFVCVHAGWTPLGQEKVSRFPDFGD